MHNPEPVYLFLGPEIGQKTDEILKIQKTFQTQAGVTPEIHKFYPYDTSISEVISLMKNGSLFSNYKFVTFMNIEELKKDDIAELIEYIKSPGAEWFEYFGNFLKIKKNHGYPAFLKKRILR